MKCYGYLVRMTPRLEDIALLYESVSVEEEVVLRQSLDALDLAGRLEDLLHEVESLAVASRFGELRLLTFPLVLFLLLLIQDGLDEDLGGFVGLPLLFLFFPFEFLSELRRTEPMSGANEISE